MSDGKTILEKATEEMRELVVNTDIEMAHVKADDILTEFLRQIGAGSLADAFDDVEKWYA